MTLRCQILGESVLDGLRDRPFGSLGTLVCGEERSEYLKTAIATNHCLRERILINKINCNTNMCKDKCLSRSGCFFFVFFSVNTTVPKYP